MQLLVIPNGTNINSRIPVHYLGSNGIKYLENTREIQFLDKGTYEIKLKLLLSSLNEADSIGVRHGEDLIQKYTIPIRGNAEITLVFTINIEDINIKMTIVNTSDDKLIINSSKGGLYMESTETLIAKGTTPLQIQAINVNNKTVTILANQVFSGSEIFKVYKDNITQNVEVTAVNDSVEPANNKKVLVANGRFETDVKYKVKLKKGSEEAETEFTVGLSTEPPLKITTGVFGDRILNVKFNVPIQNLSYIKDDILGNFYIVYYDKDVIGINSTEGALWYGSIESTIEEDGADSYESIVRVAKDYRSMEIQFNKISMPIGTHYVIANFSKEQSFLNKENMLKDFSDEGRIVPIMAGEFAPQKGATAAIPQNVTVINVNEIIVKFDKPVLNLYSERNVIYVNNNMYNIESVTREGNTFDTLRYKLSSSNHLPIGKVDITIDRITDANGYKTMNKPFPGIEVIEVPPKMVKAEQVSTPGNDEKTGVKVTFSKAMKDTDGDGGVRNSKYYKIKNLDGKEFLIDSTIQYNNSDFSAILTTSKLDEGKYKLFASGIQDTLGLVMDEQGEEFDVIDNTAPKVLSITFRNSTMIIKFDETMQLLPPHSITQRENYLIEDRRANGPQSKKEVLPPDTTMLAMNDNKWVRITLPSSFSMLPLVVDPNYLVHIGYSKLKEPVYVQNIANNMYPLEELQKIKEKIEEFDISNGTVAVLSDSQLLYKYLGKNELDKALLDPKDFIVILGTSPGKPITPLQVIAKEDNIIEFDFAKDTFDASSNTVFIKTKDSDIVSKDIYGYPIASGKSTDGKAINRLKAELEAVSLVFSDNKSAVLRMVFNKSIGTFDASDFRCTLNDENTISIGWSGQSFDNDKVFQLLLETNHQLYYNDKLQISLAVPEDLIGTKDTDGNTIKVFEPMEVSKFIAKSIGWGRSSSVGLANNKVTIEFDNEIDPRTLIANSTFETDPLNYIPWDGTNPFEIPASKLNISKDTDGIFMTISENKSFGSVEIISKTENGFISAPYTNSNKVILTLIESKKVVLEFSNDETGSANTSEIKSVKYIPGIDSKFNTIEDIRNILFLYASYNPTGVPTDV